MCSGVGACRKKLSGTMCPSYMATREESDSTRGRANVLRLAMSGQIEGEAGLGDEGVYKALDLCLECRACKAECPVGVDMARYKSEFLADYYSRHGTPMHARALGNTANLAKLGSAFAPISNWVAGTGLNKQLLGLDPRRKLPEWRRKTFAHWVAAETASAAAGASRCSTTRSPIITIRKSASLRWKFWSAADAASTWSGQGAADGR